MNPINDLIVYSSHSLKDPLFEGLMLEYLKSLKGWRIHLITEEQETYSMIEKDKADLKHELRNSMVYWKPIKYRGRPLIVVKKFITLLKVLFYLLFVRLRFKPKAIMGYLSIAGGYSWIFSKILRLPLIIFCFEPHSHYMLDFGVWDKSSLSYRLLSFFEKQEVMSARNITVPTIHTEKLLTSWGVKGSIHLLPISIDTDKFSPSDTKRNEMRRNYSVEDKWVVSYIGKFGGIYYSSMQMAGFLAQLLKDFEDLYLFIITPNDTKKVTIDFESVGFTSNNLKVISTVSYHLIQNYFRMSDMGVIAIPPLPSQVYRTPVKTGNYLSCGVPILMNRGVSDEDVIIEKEDIGAVIDNFEDQVSNLLIDRIQQIRMEERKTIADRCRKVAIDRRAMANSVNALQDILKSIDSK